MYYSTNYSLKQIADKQYLIAYGQEQADLKRDYLVDEVGAFIWQCLEKGLDIEAIVDACALKYDINPSEKGIIYAEVNSYIDRLLNGGILTKHTVSNSLSDDLVCFENSNTTDGVCLRIADVDISLYTPAECVHPYFNEFISVGEGTNARASISISCVECDVYPQINQNTIISTKLLSISQTKDSFLLWFGSHKSAKFAKLSHDGQTAQIFYVGANAENLKEEIFQIIKVCFLYKAEMCGLTAIHSSSILYKDKVWLFSGESGAGKSTQADLWSNVLGVKCINGDVNLVGVEDGKVIVYGIPWCGTSGIYTNDSYVLGGIFTVKKSDTNGIVSLNEADKILKIFHRTFSPIWTEKQLDSCLKNIEKIVNGAYIAEYFCNKETDAVYVLKNRIDE